MSRYLGISTSKEDARGMCHLSPICQYLQAIVKNVAFSMKANFLQLIINKPKLIELSLLLFSLLIAIASVLLQKEGVSNKVSVQVLCIRLFQDIFSLFTLYVF